jgi:IS4 transposase
LDTDGSSLHIATNPNDADTFFQNRPGEKGFNLLHMNAMYDLCNRLYVDSFLQPGRCENEGKALVKMVGRSHIRDNVIIIADRAYESYNNFAHIEKKGWKYLIRVKDLGSNGILSGLRLPSDGEFDICVQRILTRKQTNEVKARPDVYRFMPSVVKFDFLPLRSDDFYHMAFRVVRFKITDDSYETVITNLEQSDFPPHELKELYGKRWGIET